jgi:hypothetical protein
MQTVLNGLSPCRRVVGHFFRCYGFHDLLECVEWEDEPASLGEAPVLKLDDLQLRILLDATRLLVFLLRDRSIFLRKVLTTQEAFPDTITGTRFLGYPSSCYRTQQLMIS